MTFGSEKFEKGSSNLTGDHIYLIPLNTVYVNFLIECNVIIKNELQFFDTSFKCTNLVDFHIFE